MVGGRSVVGDDDDDDEEEEEEEEDDPPPCRDRLDGNSNRVGCGILERIGVGGIFLLLRLEVVEVAEVGVEAVDRPKMVDFDPKFAPELPPLALLFPSLPPRLPPTSSPSSSEVSDSISGI